MSMPRKTMWTRRLPLPPVFVVFVVLSLLTAVSLADLVGECTQESTEAECQAAPPQFRPQEVIHHDEYEEDCDQDDCTDDADDHDDEDCSDCEDDNDDEVLPKRETAAETVETDCYDDHEECKTWAAMGECAFNPDFMTTECRRSCVVCFEDTDQFGLHQTLPNEDFDKYTVPTQQIIDSSILYMKKLWYTQSTDNHYNNGQYGQYDRFNYKCRNMEEECSLWAAMGECQENPDYMQINCAPACQTCELLDTQNKCPIKEGNDLIYGPGDLNAMMERIVDGRASNITSTSRQAMTDQEEQQFSEMIRQYHPQVLSRPKRRADGTLVQGDFLDGPWVVTFENFVSAVEAEALIAAGASKGYDRSADVGIVNPDGSHESNVNEDRTSVNAWCDVELCNSDPIIGPVVERISNLTQTSPDHSEFLQLLKYEPGQFYKKHHDYIEYQAGMPCGVRMLTLFLYLNDVEEGGETHFPLLGISVEPKRGKAVLWPSVLDEDPEKKDFRTDHEALPVLKGVKYGANAWIHTRNYTEAEEDGCT